MGKIVLLDELTINQIAAGEVIERPASVVKEMVENSIDAGATQIIVEIKNGGISYIRIADNGKGIEKDDIEMAFERHATSKIRSANDLQDVKSMGFRGEALASIAAISNVELVTKTAKDYIGTKVIVEGGDILKTEEVGCSTGTTITVRNLFYNTPVRYKFLKRDYTETGYIEDVLTRIALVHPEIAIKLINSGKTSIQTSGNGDLKSVIYSIYGKDIATEVLPVEYQYEYINVKGVIGKPAIARSNRSNQIFFVNKRYIKNKTLTAAAEQAFKGLLPIGKFAFLILNLDMDPSKVDVNVHPAKLEVRFVDENAAFKATYSAIKNTLVAADLISEREKHKEAKQAAEHAFKIEPQVNDGGLFARKTAEDLEKEKSGKGKFDVFERLKHLQNQLKKEVEQNPNIKLTDEYKNVESKYNEISQKSDSIKEKLEEKSKLENAELLKNKHDMQTKLEVEAVENEFNDEEKSEKQIEKEEINELNDLEKNVDNKIDEQIGQNQDINIQKDENIETQSGEEQAEKMEVENPENEADNQGDIEVQGEVIEDNTDDSEKLDKQIEQETKEVNDSVDTFEQMYKKLFGKEPYYGGKKPEDPKEDDLFKINDQDLDDNMTVFEETEQYDSKKPNYKFIGIAFKTYIILEMNQELYIMDQHATHERVLYEKIKANFYSDWEKDSQLMLLPDIITLSNKEMDIAKENLDLFRKAGFMLEEFGKNTIKLYGVPEICIDLETKDLFLETLDEINTVARTAKQEKENKFIATVACKAAVKAGMDLSQNEVESLINQLFKLENPFTCPHGRPTVIKMNKSDLERKFARRK